MIARQRRTGIDPLVVEVFHFEKRFVHVVGETEASRRQGLAYDVIHQRIDNTRVRIAEHLYAAPRDIVFLYKPKLHRVFEVAPEVRDLIGHSDRHALPGTGELVTSRNRGEILHRMIRFEILLELLAAVIDDTVAYRVGQIQTAPVVCQMIDDAEAIDFVSKPIHAAESREYLLAEMPEWRMSEIMPHSDRPREIRIEIESAADRRRDRGNVHNVFDPGADMVVLRREKNLGFVFHPPERIRMYDRGRIAKEVSPEIGLVGGPRYRARP